MALYTCRNIRTVQFTFYKLSELIKRKANDVMGHINVK